MQTDLSWLKELTHKLPTLPETPTTLFDILGVATRETTISNVLAYFLDETQGHGLGRLFLDSLLACMDQEGEVFASPYTVHREWQYIDILIVGADNAWAIIIENKVYHSLNNPLDEYMKRVRAVVKGDVVGVVLTLHLTALPEGIAAGYVNVTHGKLLKEVQERRANMELPLPTDHQQQLLYDEFIQTMKTNIQQLANDHDANRSLDLLRQHDDQIKKLLATRKHVETYLMNHLKAAFEEHEFEERGKYFYYPKATAGESDLPIRFFVYNELARKNSLSIYIELYGEGWKFGDKLDKNPELKRLIAVNELVNDRENKAGAYYHLVKVSEHNFLPVHDLPRTLKQMVSRFFTPKQSLYDFLKTNLRTNQQ